ncbi:hypothetical protein HMPREF0653_02005 [Prevotella disiens JCM 6334 = ATCC 29426]|uniref:Uncharacterized protein n=1 Tax=Prevotella disiens JCM 6334 = ATCC 29426 TaxID=1235811 RepID=A0ABN0NQI3_9BACT|nr:hypothetical protein HMPREF0653_02005 [Prevotella disiens JCM 6334 = ATCC 29426]
MIVLPKSESGKFYQYRLFFTSKQPILNFKTGCFVFQTIY